VEKTTLQEVSYIQQQDVKNKMLSENTTGNGFSCERRSLKGCEVSQGGRPSTKVYESVSREKLNTIDDGIFSEG
jgi:hypothetical protein